MSCVSYDNTLSVICAVFICRRIDIALCTAQSVKKSRNCSFWIDTGMESHIARFGTTPMRRQSSHIDDCVASCKPGHVGFSHGLDGLMSTTTKLAAPLHHTHRHLSLALGGSFELGQRSPQQTSSIDSAVEAMPTENLSNWGTTSQRHTPIGFKCNSSNKGKVRSEVLFFLGPQFCF